MMPDGRFMEQSFLVKCVTRHPPCRRCPVGAGRTVAGLRSVLVQSQGCGASWCSRRAAERPGAVAGLRSVLAERPGAVAGLRSVLVQSQGCGASWCSRRAAERPGAVAGPKESTESLIPMSAPNAAAAALPRSKGIARFPPPPVLQRLPFTPLRLCVSASSRSERSRSERLAQRQRKRG